MKEKSSSNPVIVAAVITGVLGLIGVICASVISILPELNDNTPPPTQSFVPTETVQLLTPSPTDTAQPTPFIPTDTAVPTNTPEPILPTPTELNASGLPVDYGFYDDFDSEAVFLENWWFDDPKKICTTTVREGSLYFDCQNKTKNDLQASFHPHKEFPSISGAAILVTIVEAGGPFQLTTGWKCASDGTERAYNLKLGINEAEVIEFYPLEGWRGNPLGKIAVTPNVPHRLQIETSGGQVAFQVDGQDFPLTIAPDFPACLSLDNWGMDFTVWKDDNSIQGQADWTAVKP
jgi:hypothetical protein